MIASLSAELLKIRKRPANWVLFGSLLAFVIFLVYVVSYLIFTNPPPGFTSQVPPSVLKRSAFPENLVPTVLSVIPSLGAAIMLIFGALSAANEYGWMTVQTILIQGPGRLSVLAGKLTALALFSLLATAALFGFSAVISSILAGIDGAALAWPALTVLVRGFAAAWLVLAVWTAFGMALGVAFRSTAAAIGGGLTYLFVGENILAALLSNTSGIKDVLKLLPGINATSITASFATTVRGTARSGAPLVGPTRGTVTLIVYLVLFVALAAVIFRRRDVTA